MVEYAVLMGGAILFLLVGLNLFSDTISAELGDINAAIAEEEEGGDGGKCPTGWSLVANYQTKKKGQSVDANGDGMICLKNIPGGGNGNTNLNQNVKDNNGS